MQKGFDALPADYKCPQCNVGKKRFKAYVKPAAKAGGTRSGTVSGGSAYADMQAEKNANKVGRRRFSSIEIRVGPRVDPRLTSS